MRLARKLVSALGVLAAAGALWAGNAVVPKNIVVEPPNLHCVGLEYNVDGDDNENAVCAVKYRQKGDVNWNEAQPLLRVERGSNETYKVPHGNMLAGSIFWLQPDSEYEVQLSLDDPDGGMGRERVVVKTRAVPAAAARARRIPVGPATFTAALTGAEPGDLFELQPGEYGSFAVENDGAPGRPIVIRGTHREKVVVNGTIALSGRQHVILENLSVKGHVVANAGRFIAVKGCILQVTAARKPNIHGMGECQNYYIADNEILGSGTWSNLERGGCDGVKLSGSGHAICYNVIKDHWDNISLYTVDDQKKPGGFRGVAVDIYGNDFYGGRDDGVEADYQNHNIRIFKNRFTNTGSTVSFQPLFGGPGYVLYNEMYNSRIKPYKFHVSPSGLIVYHNTSLSSWNGWSGGNPSNMIVKNNIIFCNPLYKGDASGNVSTDGTKVVADYNGYNEPASGFSVSYTKAGAGRSLAELARKNMERHGVMLDLGIFRKSEYPLPGRSTKDPYGNPYEIGQVDLCLNARAGAIDVGVALPNINDGFRGTAPDLGCYEFGQPSPHYGPRPGELAKFAAN